MAPDPRPGGSPGPGPRGPRHDKRRRPRRDERGRGDQGRPRASALPPKPIFDAKKPVATPLSADEKAELKQHFAFLRKHREVLRLSVNAAEDLLLNGMREPEDRGVCIHLLGKIDRASVTGALTRLTDPEQRTRLLAGVVRFSRDVAIVVQYLESLSASASRAEAAATLTAALRQLDFSAVSAAQVRRLLQLVVAVMPEAERPAVLLSLLRGQSFRAAFDAAADVLPPELAALVVPMRAIFAALFAEGAEAQDSAALARGVELVLRAPVGLVRGLPEVARGRFCEAALTVGPLAHELETTLATALASIPKESRTYSRLMTTRARQLLREGKEAEARRILEGLRAAHPDYKIPGRWLAALNGARLGGFGLSGLGAGETPSPGLQRAFWLEQQKPVWLLVGAAAEREAFSAAAELRRALVLPGLVPLLASSAVDAPQPFQAMAQIGEPAGEALAGHQHREHVDLLATARSGVELCAALSLAGVVLPDAELRRFVVDAAGRLHLVSLVGAQRGERDAASREVFDRAHRLCTAVLDAGAGPRAYAYLRQQLEGTASFAELAQLLAASER